MKAGIAFIALLGLSASLAPAASSEEVNDWRLSQQFLYALIDRDVARVEALASNARMLDSVALEYLIGDDSYRFPERADLRSASTILRRGPVITKLVVTESEGGDRSIEIVYLPTSVAEDFAELSFLSRVGRAKPFRDYVICSFVVEKGRAYMPNACYAETDALE